jgi:hypothetical protein
MLTGFLATAARAGLVLILLVSVTGKLRSWPDFVAWVGRLGAVPATLTGATAAALAAVETGALVLTAVPATAVAGLLLTAVLMAFFGASIAALRRRGVRESCRCLGVTDRPMGPVEVVRDVALCVVALAAALAGTHESSFLGTAQAVLLGAGLAAVTVRLDDLVRLFAPARPGGPVTF